MAEDLEHPFPLWLSILACVVLIPPMLVALVMLVGVLIDGVAQRDQQHDQCLRQATNGLEIIKCN